MDLWKFESILEKNALFFSIAKEQQDELEGELPPYAKKVHAQRFRFAPPNQREIHLKNQASMQELNKTVMALSCWHINEEENLRMWNDYVIESETGVAIKSNRNLLVSSFGERINPKQLKIDEVEYDNHQGNMRRLNGRFDVYFQKDKTFEWEQELRCVFDVMFPPIPEHKNNIIRNAKELFDKEINIPVGYFIPINIHILIDAIILSPHASNSLHQDIHYLCNQHSVTSSIQFSKL